jgi:ABC-2 type transport system ATP-binding protein
MLKIENLTIRYPKVLAVDNLSLVLKPGFIYGLIGPNGAGKSSLLKCLVGLISQYEGDIYYGDLSMRKKRHTIKSKFGYAPEDPDLFPYLSGREYLTMVADIRKTRVPEQINELSKKFTMEESIDDLINRYSHGMRQKISFAAALIGKPQYLILDEALNGFDPVSLFNAKKILITLAEEGRTILLSSHVLELLEKLCQEIIVMNEGRILDIFNQDRIAQIKKRNGDSFSDHFISLINKDANQEPQKTTKR